MPDHRHHPLSRFQRSQLAGSSISPALPARARPDAALAAGVAQFLPGDARLPFSPQATRRKSGFQAGLSFSQGGNERDRHNADQKRKKIIKAVNTW